MYDYMKGKIIMKTEFINHAHRGASEYAPENTLLAFYTGIYMGANGIETDVQMTKDGVLVSCHDSTLDRVSNGTGKIYEHTYEELTHLDFGSKYGEAFAGMKILKFEEILQKLDRTNS